MNELMLREMRDQPRALTTALPDLRAQTAALRPGAVEAIVLTGSGDSLYAGMAVEHLFAHVLGLPVWALSSMSASRFVGSGGRRLVVTVSVSGAASRTIEAARAARHRGDAVLAVVADGDSPLARASDAVLVMPEPITRRTPHTRDYTLTLLALAVACEALSGRPLDFLDRWPSVVEPLLVASLAWAETLLPAPVGRSVWFLGAGPDRGTAAYGAMKLWEAGGSASWWDDLEEFGHGSQLVARPGDDVVLVAPRPSRSRAREVMPLLARMGVRPVPLMDGPAEPGSIPLPPVPHWSWAPFVSCIPVQALAYVYTTHRGVDTLLPLGGKPHGQTFEDVHTEWVGRSAVEA